MRSLALSAFCLCLLPAFAHAEEQVRTVSGYDSVCVKGPFDLEVEAGKAHSLTISGKQEYFSQITTEVVGNCLKISFEREDHHVELKDLPHVHVTLPELRRLTEEGAGQTLLTHIDSQRLDIDYKGAGRLAAGGKVQDLRIKAQGVGEFDARDLIAQDARVKFEGVGDVRIYASHSLDLAFGGMGDLTYYGHPSLFNKTGAGFGSVKAGD